MQFTFKIIVGQTAIEITESAESHQDFIKKLSFFSSIPTKGPNGEDDLKFVYRKTTQGHEYYSLISDRANKEYKFGQSNKELGTMYGKGWENKFITGDSEPNAPTIAAPATLATTTAPVVESITPVATSAVAPSASANSAVNDVLARYGIGN